MKRFFLKSINVAVASLFLLILFRFAMDTFQLDWGLRIYPLLLFVLLIVYAGIRSNRLKQIEKDEIIIHTDFGFVIDFKAALRPSALFALVYSLFVWVFHSFLNPLLFLNMIEDQKQAIILEGINHDNQQEVDALLASFERFADFVFSPLNWATFTLFGLIFLSFFYSLILVAFIRKFPQLLLIPSSK
jgi:hypothetical protein